VVKELLPRCEESAHDGLQHLFVDRGGELRVRADGGPQTRTVEGEHPAGRDGDHACRGTERRKQRRPAEHVSGLEVHQDDGTARRDALADGDMAMEEDAELARVLAFTQQARAGGCVVVPGEKGQVGARGGRQARAEPGRIDRGGQGVELVHDTTVTLSRRGP
jgi:hypothetical protein